MNGWLLEGCSTTLALVSGSNALRCGTGVTGSATLGFGTGVGCCDV